MGLGARDTNSIVRVYMNKYISIYISVSNDKMNNEVKGKIGTYDDLDEVSSLPRSTILLDHLVIQGFILRIFCKFQNILFIFLFKKANISLKFYQNYIKCIFPLFSSGRVHKSEKIIQNVKKSKNMYQ